MVHSVWIIARCVLRVVHVALYVMRRALGGVCFVSCALFVVCCVVCVAVLLCVVCCLLSEVLLCVGVLCLVQ